MGKKSNKNKLMASKLLKSRKISSKSVPRVSRNIGAKQAPSNPEKLRYKYDLNTRSIVIDLGVFRGDWIAGIDKYGCRIYGYEPIKQFFQGAKQRFANNQKVTLFNYAIGNSNRHDKICVDGDASSIFVGEKQQQAIKVVSIVDEYKRLGSPIVDLMKINVEGSEYEILEMMIEHGIVNKFKNLQIQFHNFQRIKAAERKKQICAALLKTHHISYTIFGWENWEIN